MGLLEGQRAVITGGGSGIGRATARRMADEGASVAVIDINGDAAHEIAAGTGISPLGRKATRPEVRRFDDMVVDRDHPPIERLVRAIRRHRHLPYL